MHVLMQAKRRWIGSLLTVFSALCFLFLAAVAITMPSAYAAGAIGRSAQTAWSSYGFDSQNTRFNPGENVLNIHNVARLRNVWRASTNGAVVSSPAVAKGLVYVGSNGGLFYAFNIFSGKYVWTATRPPSYGPNGRTTATILDGSIISSPAVDSTNDSKVYYEAQPDSTDPARVLRVINATSGLEQGWAPKALDRADGVGFSPVIVGKTVYIGAGVTNMGAGGKKVQTGEIMAFDAEEGTLRWTGDLGEGLPGYAPAVANGIVYIGSGNGNLYAFNAASGRPLWHTSVGASITGAPAVSNGIIYVGTSGNQLFALDAKTGHQIWVATVDGSIHASPAIAHGVVYVGTGNIHGAIYAFNAGTGHALWRTTVNAPIVDAPAVANGVLYIGSIDGKLYALNADTGKILFTFQTGGRIESSPAVVDGKVYVGSDDGNLYAFQL